LGTTAVQLIRHSPCSVLFVPRRRSEPVHHVSVLDSDQELRATVS
jgi:hypothetical protein